MPRQWAMSSCRVGPGRRAPCAWSDETSWPARASPIAAHLFQPDPLGFGSALGSVPARGTRSNGAAASERCDVVRHTTTQGPPWSSPRAKNGARHRPDDEAGRLHAPASRLHEGRRKYSAFCSRFADSSLGGKKETKKKEKNETKKRPSTRSGGGTAMGPPTSSLVKTGAMRWYILLDGVLPSCETSACPEPTTPHPRRKARLEPVETSVVGGIFFFFSFSFIFFSSLAYFFSRGRSPSPRLAFRTPPSADGHASCGACTTDERPSPCFTPLVAGSDQGQTAMYDVIVLCVVSNEPGRCPCAWRQHEVATSADRRAACEEPFSDRLAARGDGGTAERLRRSSYGAHTTPTQSRRRADAEQTQSSRSSRSSRSARTARPVASSRHGGRRPGLATCGPFFSARRPATTTDGQAHARRGSRPRPATQDLGAPKHVGASPAETGRSTGALVASSAGRPCRPSVRPSIREQRSAAQSTPLNSGHRLGDKRRPDGTRDRRPCAPSGFLTRRRFDKLRRISGSRSFFLVSETRGEDLPAR